MQRALTGARVFDGERFLENHGLVFDDVTQRIVAIVDAASIQASDALAVERLAGGILSAGFIDAQVNGGGGVMFNNDASTASIETILAAHSRFGTTALLPTLITDAMHTTEAALRAVERGVREVPGCIGIHLEGPFLSPAKKGAHDEQLIRAMNDADVDALCAWQVGKMLITLAPERCEARLIRRLVDHGVIVSLGHSNADYATAMEAIDAGARCVTHLYNAMSGLQHREPGLVGATLDAPQVWAGIIADGLHVHPAALRVAVQAKNAQQHADGNAGKLFLVTDAMSTVGSSDAQFILNGREVRRQGLKLTLADGTLAGSHLDMASAIRYSVANLRVSVTEALRMASVYPAQMLGLSDRGRLQPGFVADIAHLDDALQVDHCWRSARRASI